MRALPRDSSFYDLTLMDLPGANPEVFQSGTSTGALGLQFGPFGLECGRFTTQLDGGAWRALNLMRAHFQMAKLSRRLIFFVFINDVHLNAGIAACACKFNARARHVFVCI